MQVFSFLSRRRPLPAVLPAKPLSHLALGIERQQQNRGRPLVSSHLLASPLFLIRTVDSSAPPHLFAAAADVPPQEFS